MPKVTDIKAYWREIAAKAGLEGKDLEQVSAVLDNDKFAKAFTDGFKPLPDYSHDLDDVRNKTKADKDKEYDNWFKTEKAKYENNERIWAQQRAALSKYEEVFGPIDVNNPPNPGDPNRGGKVLSQDDIDKLVETKLQAVLTHRDQAVMDLMDVREFHMDKFKKSFDTKAFEAAWKDHPEWGGSLKLAYQQFVAPEIEKIKEADVEARIKAAREEGIRDGYSRRALPTDHQSKEFSPMFDRKEEVAKLSDADQDRHSREEFFKGLREPAKQPA